MTGEEYERRRREIIADAEADIDAHLCAGKYGDAENARKWLRVRLRMLETQREAG